VTPANLAATVLSAARAVFETRGLDVATLPETTTMERPRNPEHGDYASTLAMQLGKKAGVAPRELAAALAEELEKHPAVKEVGIAGRVTDSYGFAGAGAYEIDDGTGRIWVATKHGVPSRGSQVGAKGYVHNGFSFNGRSFGTVMEETDRRTRGR